MIFFNTVMKRIPVKLTFLDYGHRALVLSLVGLSVAGRYISVVYKYSCVGFDCSFRATSTIDRRRYSRRLGSGSCHEE